MTFKDVLQASREAGPWTDGDAQEAKRLRQLSKERDFTQAERDALRVLRYREIAECVRLRRAAAARKP